MVLVQAWLWKLAPLLCFGWVNLATAQDLPGSSPDTERGASPADEQLRDLTGRILDLSNNNKPFVRFTIRPETSIVFASMPIGRKCGEISYDINYVVSDVVEYPATRLTQYDNQVVRAEEFILPPGDYVLRPVVSAVPNCNIAVSLSYKSTATTSGFSQEERELDDKMRKEDEELTNRVKLGLILRGKGSFVDIEKVKIFDKERRVEKDRIYRSGYTTPYKDDEIYVDLIKHVCFVVGTRLQRYGEANELGRVDRGNGAPLDPWTWGPGGEEEKAEITKLLGMGFTKAYVAATKLPIRPTSIDYTDGMPEPVGSMICDHSAVPIPELIKTLKGPLTPKIAAVVHFNDAGSASDIAATIAEILNVPPADVWLSFKHERSGLCSGAVYLGAPPFTVESTTCGHSSSAIVRIPRSATGTPGHSEASVNSAIPESRVNQAIRAVLGSSVRISELLSVGPMTRLRISDMKGNVVPGGRDWEVLVLTVVQAPEQGGINVSLIAEGMLSSGLGKHPPPLSSFTRSMDVETPAALQEFVNKLSTKLLRSGGR